MVVCALIFATRDALEIPEIELPGKALVLHSSEIPLKNTGDEALLAVDFYCFTVGLPRKDAGQPIIFGTLEKSTKP